MSEIDALQHAFAVLRRTVIEHPVKVEDEELRDTCIKMFLDELQEVVTPRLIQSLPDEHLGEMFVDWVKAMPDLRPEQRIAALVLDVRLCRVPFLLYRKGYAAAREEAPVPAGNVVPLHRS